MSIKQPVQVSVYSIKDLVMITSFALSFPSLIRESKSSGSSDPFDI